MVTGILTPTQSIAVVLAAMVALVVISSLLEARTPRRGGDRRHPPARPARREAAGAPAGAAGAPAGDAAGAPAGDAAGAPAGVPAQPLEEPPTMLARVQRPGGAAVQLGAPGAAQELAAVLFAAYVASGRPERGRVTGWVAPDGRPPSLPELHAGEHLRGRPGRVTALLGCRDEGRNWVALDPDTDIALGLTRRPPADECLRGIAWWWTLAVGRADAIPAEHAGVVRGGVEAVAGALKGHPFAATARGSPGSPPRPSASGHRSSCGPCPPRSSGVVAATSPRRKGTGAGRGTSRARRPRPSSAEHPRAPAGRAG